MGCALWPPATLRAMEEEEEAIGYLDKILEDEEDSEPGTPTSPGLGCTFLASKKVGTHLPGEERGAGLGGRCLGSLSVSACVTAPVGRAGGSWHLCGGCWALWH